MKGYDAAALQGSPSGAPLDQAAMLLLVVLCAVWGLNQIAIKVGNAGFSPVFQAALRSIGALPLIVLWARHRGIPLLARDETFLPGIVAGLLFSAEFVLLYWGLTYTTASRSVVFLYSMPFIVAIGAHFVVPGDRLTRAKSLGLLAAFAGVLIAFADSLYLPTSREMIGDALCFGGAVAYGVLTVLIKGSKLGRVRVEKVLFYELLVSALLLPLASILLGEKGVVHPTPLALGALAYQIIVVVAISYTAWTWLMTKYSASRMASFSFLTPIFGVVFGALLLNETVSPALVVSVALIAAGIYLVNRPENARNTHASQ